MHYRNERFQIAGAALLLVGLSWFLGGWAVTSGAATLAGAGVFWIGVAVLSFVRSADETTDMAKTAEELA